MKRLQSLLASFVLTVAFAVSTSAGIIHTGSPEPPPPPPSQSNTADEGAVEDETTALDLFLEAALDCLHGTVTLF